MSIHTDKESNDRIYSEFLEDDIFLRSYCIETAKKDISRMEKDSNLTYERLYYEKLRSFYKEKLVAEEYKESLHSTESAFLITLYTIVCFYLTYTRGKVHGAMLIPMFLISVFTTKWVDYYSSVRNCSTKRKILIKLGVLVSVPFMVYLWYIQ